MLRECPGCGATATPEARFCRRCGVPFRATGGHDTDSPVSPRAQTIPLADDGRTTDGLLTEESQQLASGTSRIRRTEMEEMLRRINREHGDGDGHASHPPLSHEDRRAPHVGAHATSTLQATGTDAPADKTSPATTTTSKKAGVPRRWPLWQWALVIVLCGMLVTGLIAFISYRRASVAKAGDIPVVPVGEEKQQDASAEPPAQPEQAVAETSEPTTALPPRPEPSSRTRGGTEASSLRPASETPDASTAPPAASSQTKQTATTPVPVLSPSERYRRGVQLWESDRRAALEEFRVAASAGVADAYYYLGTEYYSEGRDPKTLSDGELRAALNYFLRAGGGPHSAQANRAAQALGKEYERRKKHSRR